MGVFSITDFIIEQPAYIKYLIFLGALTVDEGFFLFTNKLFSFTGTISGVLSAITGVDFGLNPEILLLLALILGALMAALFLQGALGRK